jgi:hypothetical protein
MKTQLQRYGESIDQRRRSISELLRRAERSGMCKVWPGPVTPPKGWVACNGAEINRFEFAGIFAVIGTNYGAGNGTSTFNLPAWGEPCPGGCWIMKV